MKMRGGERKKMKLMKGKVSLSKVATTTCEEAAGGDNRGTPTGHEK